MHSGDRVCSGYIPRGKLNQPSRKSEASGGRRLQSRWHIPSPSALTVQGREVAGMMRFSGVQLPTWDVGTIEP